jgi:endonuclease/exonuclease/phosphatase family metal-dependent hydrolase
MKTAGLFTITLLLSSACGATAPDPGERARAAEAPSAGAGADAVQETVRARGLKLASWNLEWLNRKSGHGPVKREDADYARLRRYVDKLDADIIAFQEVDGLEAAKRVFDTGRYELYVAEQSDPQRTGFAYRKGLHVSINPDYAALDVGQVRVGADITVEYEGKHVRLLSVHLKSGCFDQPLSSETKDCRKLFAQLPSLEAWIDDRAIEGISAVVLGDFNRRLFARPDEPFWRELDDSEPPDSDLWAPTEGQTSRCWGGQYKEFIDHLVLNRRARELYVEQSFEQLLYDARDAEHKRVLSDHCPLSISLRLSGSSLAERPPNAGELPSQASASEPRAASAADAGALEQRVKGNIGAGRRKLYHAPGCPDYARTQIDESKGERWFASEAEAEAAGFARSSNCAARK